MKDTMVCFKNQGYEFAIALTNVIEIVKSGKRVTIIYSDTNYRNIDCETEAIAGNIFDGIVNAKASSNEVYKIIG
jgi:hypothetical protein